MNDGKANLKDSWDWPYLLYIALCVLRIPENFFWKVTPRGFKSMMDIYVESHQEKGGKGSKKKTTYKAGFIDEII